MGTHKCEYKGIEFTIHAEKESGRWHRSYTLASELHELRERPLSSEQLAVGDAERDAQRRIDQGAGR